MATVTLRRAALAAALADGRDIVEKSQIPVLNNVRLHVERGEARLQFSNLEQWLSTSVQAEADAIVATTLPAVMFTDAVKSMSGDDLRLVITDGRCGLQSGRARINLPTIAADQYPALEAAKHGGLSAAVDGRALAEAINATVYASSDGIGSFLAGVHFAFDEGGEVELWSVDGTRMAVNGLRNDGDVIPSFTLPLRATRTLARLCADCSDIRISADDRTARFTIGGWLLQSKIVDGKFRTFPEMAAARDGEPIMFDPRELEAALGRLAVVSDQYSRGVRFDLDADKLTVSLANPKSGDATEEVPVGYEGEPITLGYSLAFVRDALRQIPGDDAAIFIAAGGVKRATLVARPDEGGTHIIGPFAV